MQNNILKRFKEHALNSGVIGFFCKTTDSSLIEAAGYGGADFLILDMEHGPASLETIQSHVRAAVIGGAVPIVRVTDWKDPQISSALDVGALGIQVPNITSVEQIEHVIKKARFYPDGSRGVCRYVKSAKYGESLKEEYFSTSNENLIIIQIEGKNALNDLDRMLDVDGYDILFIGPYDLSQSLGLPGQIEHEVVLEKMKSIIVQAHNKNKMVGIFADTFNQLDNWKTFGLNYYAYSVDISLFRQSIKSIKNHFISRD